MADEKTTCDFCGESHPHGPHEIQTFTADNPPAVRSMPPPMSNDDLRDVVDLMLSERYFDMYMAAKIGGGAHAIGMVWPIANMGGFAGYTAEQLNELVIWEQMNNATGFSQGELPTFFSAKLMLLADRVKATNLYKDVKIAQGAVLDAALGPDTRKTESTPQ